MCLDWLQKVLEEEKGDVLRNTILSSRCSRGIIASQVNDVKANSLSPSAVPRQSEESGELQIYVKIVVEAR